MSSIFQDERAAKFPGVVIQCATCRYVLGGHIEAGQMVTPQRCRLYKAGKHPMLTQTATANPRKCGPSLVSWLPIVTEPPKGERTPSKPGFELSKEVIALVDEQAQYFVDHIQRRDRNWTENMDVFRSRHD